MKVTPTPIQGAMLIEPEPITDTRGSFARVYCFDTLKRAGADYRFVQANMSSSIHPGTLRGLHYQDQSAPEAKLIRCTRGSVFDVLVDLRPGSATYAKWFGVELSAQNGQAMLVPPLCAHGYLALEENSEVHYMVSSPYTPTAERGVRFDDPSIGIDWPIPVRTISEKDRKWPDLKEQGLLT